SSFPFSCWCWCSNRPDCSGGSRRRNLDRESAMTKALVAAIARPFANIPEERRRRAGLIVLILGAIMFPLVHQHPADSDSMATAASYAVLALGLNIVVGFAGLLDLGYAAFFAIGAYTYGILSSFQLQPEWSTFWEPFRALGLVSKMAADVGDGSV